MNGVGASLGMPQVTFPSVLLYASYHKNMNIWVRGGDLNVFFEILGLYKLVGPGHASGSALDSGISNCLAKLYFNSYHIKKKSEQ